MNEFRASYREGPIENRPVDGAETVRPPLDSHSFSQYASFSLFFFEVQESVLWKKEEENERGKTSKFGLGVW